MGRNKKTLPAKSKCSGGKTIVIEKPLREKTLPEEAQCSGRKTIAIKKPLREKKKTNCLQSLIALGWRKTNCYKVEKPLIVPPPPILQLQKSQGRSTGSMKLSSVECFDCFDLSNTKYLGCVIVGKGIKEKTQTSTQNVLFSIERQL